MPQIIGFIQSLLGTDYYTTVISPDGWPVVVYSAEYITGAILLIMFVAGFFKIISNFQVGSRRWGNK